MTKSDPTTPPLAARLAFLELTQDLDSIYNSYARNSTNALNDTLDLQANEPSYLASRLRAPGHFGATNSALHSPLGVVDLEDNSYDDVSDINYDSDNENGVLEVIKNESAALLGQLSLSDVYRSESVNGSSDRHQDSSYKDVRDHYNDDLYNDGNDNNVYVSRTKEQRNGSRADRDKPNVPASLSANTSVNASVNAANDSANVSANASANASDSAIPAGPSRIHRSAERPGVGETLYSSLDISKIADQSSQGDHYLATKVVPDPSDPSKYTTLTRGVEDFKFGKLLGEGSYLTVVLGTDKHTSTKYAVKILDKRHIIKEKKVKYVNIEKHALNRLANRCGIILLYFTFQDKNRLYFVLEYASNGELLGLIKKYGSLNESCVRHFSAQLLDAINFMHSNGVIHRDIKPENILLDLKMRLQITDFGTARLLEKRKKTALLQSVDDQDEDEEEEYPLDVRAKLFVGTAEYVLPELLDLKYCGKPGDIWAFGCIVYQMIAGKPPFKGANEYQTFQRITKLQYAFSAGFPVVIRDLIKQILVLQPLRRFTIAEIQKHVFYDDVNWSDFDGIWMSGHPDLGPYKMSAKLMMKPTLLLQKKPAVVKLASYLTSNSTSNSVKSYAQSSSNVSTAKPSAKRTQQSNVNPASAAAVALYQDDEAKPPTSKEVKEIKDRDIKEIKEKTEKRRPAADYIPGTNILRPQVNSQAIRTLTAGSRRHKDSASSSLSSSLKQKSKVLDVTPITPLEQAWVGYLKHSDERILKIGPVTVQKMHVDAFERRYKGQVVDLPLGGSKIGRNGAPLVMNGGNSTLRGVRQTGSDDVDTSSYSESDSLIIPPSPKPLIKTSTDKGELKRLGSSKDKRDDESHSGSKRSLFKKLLHVDTRNSDGPISPSSSQQGNNSSLLDKQQSCTMLITTHGRVLLFLRDDTKQNYRLVLEVKLNYPFVLFKEIYTSGVSSKFLQRNASITGTYGIKLIETVLVFEVEKFDVNLWIDALIKARTNEKERVLESKQKGSTTITSSPKLSSTKTPPIPSTSNFTTTSPKMTELSNEGSFFGGIRVNSPSKNSSDLPDLSILYTSKPVTQRSTNQELMMSQRTKSTKRKPPPPIESHLNMSTGLSGDADAAYLQAAQRAASKVGSPTVPQRSSFSKEPETNNWSTPYKSRIVHPKQGPQQITSSNSKLLSRSRNK